jgi:His/Glu/Gln/Arg/opine family amino acid ABC transporter permease subunit
MDGRVNLLNLFSLLKGAFLTVEISLAAIVIGLSCGLCLGILSCQKIRSFPVSALISTYVTVMRGTPLFVQILIIYFGLPAISGLNFSPFVAGVIALGLNSTAYIAEIVRAGLNSIPFGQWEASQVLGYSSVQTLRLIILPQAMRTILPPLTNELISLVKESSILMLVGVPELTKVSKDIVSREMNPMEMYLMVGLFYLAITSLIYFALKKIDRKSNAY